MNVGAIEPQPLPSVLVRPAASDSPSWGDCKIPASIRFWTIAGSIAEFGISTNFSERQSPPFLSTHDLVASALRSLSAGVPIVFPFRSAPVLYGESGATCSSENGVCWRESRPGQTMTIGMSRRCAAKSAGKLVREMSYEPVTTAVIEAVPLFTPTSCRSIALRANRPVLIAQ